MNERAYISTLSRLLSPLSARERQEILDDYRRHFSDGRNAGESDAQIIARLGSPEEVAAGFFDEDFEPQFEHAPAQSSGAPRWVKVLICAVGGMWLVAALVLTLNLYFPRKFYSESMAIGVPMATAVENPAMPDYEVIIQSDEMMSALREDIERIILDSGRTIVSSVGVDIGTLEQYAQNDWTNWVAGVGTAEMREESSGYAFILDVSSIRVLGAYNMSCSIVTKESESSVSVYVRGDIPVQHRVDVQMKDDESGELQIIYADNGTNANLPRGNVLHVEIVVPASWSGEMDISTMSGSIVQDERVNTTQIDASSISGSIRLDGKNGKTRATSVNGSVLLSGASESVTVSTVSGTIRAFMRSMPESMSLSSVSGSIAVCLNGKYDFEWSCVSGTLFNNSDAVQSRTSQYKFSTVSGDVLLEPYAD